VVPQTRTLAVPTLRGSYTFRALHTAPRCVCGGGEKPTGRGRWVERGGPSFAGGLNLMRLDLIKYPDIRARGGAAAGEAWQRYQGGSTMGTSHVQQQ
jgi:hypothetical protein